MSYGISPHDQEKGHHYHHNDHVDQEKPTTEFVEHADASSSSRRDSSILEVHDDPKLTRKLLWKLDLRILPMLALLFLFSFLDRTSIGNAKVLGLNTDLGLSSGQYANSLAIFFAFYIASEGGSRRVSLFSYSSTVPLLFVLRLLHHLFAFLFAN
jgi:hypothetical protein